MMAFNEKLPTRNIAPNGPKVLPTCPNCGVQLQGNVCPKCGYKRVVGYKIEPTTDMTGHGFDKTLLWKEIVYDDAKDQWHIVTYLFDVDAFPCQSCKTVEYTWLMAGRTGVYKTCLGCHKTSGPLSKLDATEQDNKIVQPEVVEAIYKARQLKIPKELQKALMARRSRVTKRKKISKNIRTY